MLYLLLFLHLSGVEDSARGQLHTRTSRKTNTFLNYSLNFKSLSLKKLFEQSWLRNYYLKIKHLLC